MSESQDEAIVRSIALEAVPVAHRSENERLYAGNSALEAERRRLMGRVEYEMNERLRAENERRIQSSAEEP